ncbi:MAG: branched-chain amino acid ABC transporter permease, partial [Chloroflexi bacterium]|nr:branched-chain amino acid ABC transporter permease [Chloroflexota bacterium]
MGLPCGVFNTNYKSEMAIVRTRTQWTLLIVGLGILFCLPFFLAQKWLLMINVAGISLIAALGLHILLGLCGQISVGQAAFVGVGAYVYAYLVVHQEISCLLAIPVAAISVGLVSLIFGLPSGRVKGFYLAMMTLGAQFLLLWCFGHIAPDILGGGDGMVVPRAAMADISLRTEAQQFYLIMPIAIIALFFAKNIARTKIGRAFIAIRDNELSAQLMGISPFNYKIVACFICGLYAGVAGALWAQYL